MTQSERSVTGPDGSSDAVTSASEYHHLCVLVDRIKQKDPEAMAELYTLVHNFSKYRFVRSLGMERADDTIHTIFMIMVERIRKDNLREPDRLMGYIRTIAYRVVSNQIRCDIATRKTAVPFDAECTISDKGASADDSLIRRERLRILQDCLRQLSSRNREILERFYLLEQSAEQIQVEMGLTTTQFRLFKSRAKEAISEIGRRNYGPRPPLRKIHSTLS